MHHFFLPLHFSNRQAGSKPCTWFPGGREPQVSAPAAATKAVDRRPDVTAKHLIHCFPAGRWAPQGTSGHLILTGWQGGRHNPSPLVQRKKTNPLYQTLTSSLSTALPSRKPKRKVPEEGRSAGARVLEPGLRIVPPTPSPLLGKGCAGAGGVTAGTVPSPLRVPVLLHLHCPTHPPSCSPAR